MAGTVAPGLRRGSNYDFALAGDSDDADLRRLLRDMPMPGAISISLEREPNFFAGIRAEGDEHQTLLCRDQSGRVVGMGTRSVRESFLVGRSERTGYLSQLRLAHSAQGGFHLVSRGYRMLRDLHEQDGLTRVYLTSILESNSRAKRLLEAGLRGMPSYRAIDRFETSIVHRAPSVRSRGYHIRRGRPGEGLLVSMLLNECNRPFNLAPVWDEDRISDLAPLGLTMDRFFIAEQDGRPVACAAIWDQRSFKQSVVRAYRPAIRRLRPVLNVLGGWLGHMQLHEVGRPLPLQFLSHAACVSGRENAFAGLVSAASAACRLEGCSLVAGFASRHPLATVMARCARRVLPSTLYAVSWDDGVTRASELCGSVVHAEVSLL